MRQTRNGLIPLIHPCANLLPDIENAKLLCPRRDIRSIDLLSADFQNPGDVSQVLLGTAFAIKFQFFQNYILR